MRSNDAIEVQPYNHQNSNINLMKSLGSQSERALGTSEQYNLMGSNINVEDENEDEFDNKKQSAKLRKTTIADAIDEVDQGKKKKGMVVKKKKKKGSKKTKDANKDQNGQSEE